MEKIDNYLNALTACEITGRTPKEMRLNGYRHLEYERAMGDMYEDFRLEILSGSHSVPYFVSITRRVEEARNQVVHFQKIVERTPTDSPMFRPLYRLFGYYRRQVEKTVELVESVNIMKLTQATSAQQAVPVAEEKVPEAQSPAEHDAPAEMASIPTPVSSQEKGARRCFNDKSTSHPGEYWGYKEMEKGEGISHSTAWAIVKNPYYSPAIRYVARNLRVDISILHELQQKAAAEKHKPIGVNPRRRKN